MCVSFFYRLGESQKYRIYSPIQGPADFRQTEIFFHAPHGALPEGGLGHSGGLAGMLGGLPEDCVSAARGARTIAGPLDGQQAAHVATAKPLARTVRLHRLQ